ncbi:S8 family serine peptidase [Nonomuraea sp. NBC_01738]|uniref:S8 family serine peptidase n=1 Tax=Nonomuraea sp. NBC_01738 TaxID=2976003 RepID=UPI002E0E0252|nr:S8 family serine peptidase [Nonomuraea sp. NBC_01738]
MRLQHSAISADMDPQLQWAASREPGQEVGVLALVDDADGFRALDGVTVETVIDDVEGRSLVIGKIRAGRVEAVRGAPGVHALKLARPVGPNLYATVPDLGAGALLGEGPAHGGKGVLVGIIDYGMDIAHRDFLRPDGSTRVSVLWDQRAEALPGGGLPYGRRHSARDIDLALSQPDPYTALGYDPGKPGMHGTHVCGIAAGNGGGSAWRGVAPEADLGFVHLMSEELGEPSFFGDQGHLLAAAQFLFEEAGDRPCVINISLGTNGGPHDGSSLVEKGLDALVAQRPNRAVVLSAGNAFAAGVHAQGKVTKTSPADVTWRVPLGPPTAEPWFSELEIWYAGHDAFLAEIIAPDGGIVGRVEPGRSMVWPSQDRPQVLVAHRADDSMNHDNVIDVFVDSHAPRGSWTVRLRGLEVRDGTYHAWIEREDDAQASFPLPRDNSRTLGSIACGRLTIAVGAYDATLPGSPLAPFSAAGPTRDGRQRPEISAHGVNVVAPRSGTTVGMICYSGTSMATPAVTGVVALMLAEALSHGLALEAPVLRRLLFDAARGDGWDPRYGFGRANALDAVLAVRKLIP